jgi:hypothetical protein
MESLWLATIFFVGGFMVAFLMRGPTIDQVVLPNIRVLFTQNSGPVPIAPLIVFSDSFLILFPLSIFVFLSLHATMAIYRTLFLLGRPSSVNHFRFKRRAAILAYYGSGLMPVLGLALSGIIACLTARLDQSTTTGPARWWYAGTLAVCAPVAIWAFFVPTIILLRKGAHVTPFRATILTLLFPILQPIIWLTIGALTFWVTGYLTIAIWSTLH